MAIHHVPRVGGVEKSTNVRFAMAQKMVSRAALSVAGVVAPKPTQKAIVEKAFVAARRPMSDVQKAMLARGEAHEVIVRGAQIRCWRWATEGAPVNAPTVVLAHGWNGRGVQLMGYIDPLVAAGYAVVAYDTYGHGESEGGPSNYFLFTDVLRQVLRAEFCGPVQWIIAHSLGGAAAINAVEKEGVAPGLMLLAPALDLLGILRGWFWRNGVPTFIFDDIAKQYGAALGYEMERDNPLALLGRISSSVFIMHDPGDDMAPFADSQAAVSAHSHVSLHTVQGMGHRRILSDPDAISTALGRILHGIRCESPARSRPLDNLSWMSPIDNPDSWMPHI